MKSCGLDSVKLLSRQLRIDGRSPIELNYIKMLNQA